MFSANEVIHSLKSMRVLHTPAGLSHTQNLRYCAQKLGFPSYEAFRAYLANPPSDRVGKVYTTLMRKICSLRLPSEGLPYVFYMNNDDSISYYSFWVGWDRNGNEVREPRVECFRDLVSEYREAFTDPVYVLDTREQLISWLFLWKASAIIPYELAKEFFGSHFNKKHLVAIKPPMNLVEENVLNELRGKGFL